MCGRRRRRRAVADPRRVIVKFSILHKPRHERTIGMTTKLGLRGTCRTDLQEADLDARDHGRILNGRIYTRLSGFLGFTAVLLLHNTRLLGSPRAGRARNMHDFLLLFIASLGLLCLASIPRLSHHGTENLKWSKMWEGRG